MLNQQSSKAPAKRPKHFDPTSQARIKTPIKKKVSAIILKQNRFENQATWHLVKNSQPPNAVLNGQDVGPP